MNVINDLQERLAGLPQELFEYIYDLTFTSDERIQSIYEGYRPPSILQVDRSTRETFAETFYGREDAIFFCWDHEKCLKWLLSLPREHVAMLHHVRCATEPSS
jgi:hypothetical protein